MVKEWLEERDNAIDSHEEVMGQASGQRQKGRHRKEGRKTVRGHLSDNGTPNRAPIYYGPLPLIPNVSHDF